MDKLFDNRYQLGELLGEGGMGVVHRAYDVKKERHCALKLLHPRLTRSRDILRFKREFRATMRLSHPNCVQVFDLGHCPAGWYFTMELVPGGNIKEAKTRDLVEVATIGLQIIAALDHIHSKNIIHRDIKPRNVLLFDPDQQPGPPQIKLTDFGIAQSGEMQEQITIGAVMGSLPYLSPEQVEEGRIDPRSDLYSLGIVLYELLGGRHPYAPQQQVEDRQWLDLHLQAEPMPLETVNPQVPADLSRIIMRLLAKDPAKRYVTAGLLYNDLLAWLRGFSPRFALPSLPPLSHSSYLAAPPFIGRAFERQRMKRFLERALSPVEQHLPLLLVLEGPAGVGKSRLAGQIFKLAKALNSQLVLGIGRSEPGAPFEPILPLLNHLGLREEKPNNQQQQDPPTQTPEQETRLAIAMEQAVEESNTFLQILDRNAPPTGEKDTALSEIAQPLIGEATSSATIPAGPAAQRRMRDLAPAELVPAASGRSPFSSSSRPRSSSSSLFNELRGVSAYEHRAGRHWEFQHNIAEHLLVLARYEPLVFLLEDAQWADAPTLELLSFLVRAVTMARERGEPVQVAFVITHRPAVDHRALRELHDLLGAQNSLEHILLAPFDATQAEELVAAMLMTDLSAPVRALTQRIWHQVGGNPLELGQTLHALVAAGRLQHSAQGWNIEQALLGLEQLEISHSNAIGERAAYFSHSTRALLETAAIMGRRFSLGALEQVLHTPQELVLDGLDEAIRAGFLEEEANEQGGYQFTHDRFREAIIEQLPAPRAAQLHRQIAGYLERTSATRDEIAAALAWHYAACQEHQKAYAYSLRAAEFAMETFAFARAADFFAQAIQLAQQSQLEIPGGLRERHGDACLQAGYYDLAAGRFSELLTQEEQPLQRSELLRKLAEVDFRRGDTLRAAATLEATLDEMGLRLPQSKLGLIISLARTMLVFGGYVSFPRLLIRRKRAPKDSSQEVMVRITSRLAEAYYRLDVPRCLFLQTKSLNMAEQMGPSRELAVACAQQALALGSFGWRRAGFRYVERARQMAEQVAGPVELAWVALMHAMCHAYLGDARKHDQQMRRAVELLKDSVEPLRLRQSLIVRGEGLLALGRLLEAEPLAWRATHLAEELRDQRGRGWGLYILGHIALRRGELEVAIQRLRESYRLLSLQGHDHAYGLSAGSRLVLALALHGELEEALELGYQVAEENARRFLRHFACPADGIFLAVAALAYQEQGQIASLHRRAVTRIIRWRWGYARCLRYTRPLYLAGQGCWDLATGHPLRGQHKMRQAIQLAEQLHLPGELHDVYAIMAVIFAGNPALHRDYSARTAQLREQFANPNLLDQHGAGIARPAEEPC